MNEFKCEFCNRTLAAASCLTMHRRFCDKNPSGAEGIRADAIQERREQVILSRLWGTSFRHIAQGLGISIGTAHADAEIMLGEFQKQLDPTLLHERMTKEARLIESMEEVARQEYFRSLGEAPNIRAALYSRWLATWEAKVKVFQSFGLLTTPASGDADAGQMPDYSKMHRGWLEEQRKNLLNKLAVHFADEKGILTLGDGQQVRFERLGKPQDPPPAPTGITEEPRDELA